MVQYILTSGNDNITGSVNDFNLFYETSPGVAGGTDTLRGGASGDTFILAAGGAGLVDGGDFTDYVSLTGSLGSRVYTNVEVLIAPYAIGTIAQFNSFLSIVAGSDPAPILIELTGEGGEIDFSEKSTTAVIMQNTNVSSSLTLRGTWDHDVLQGSTFEDTLSGGLGDDTYILDGNDTIIEAFDEGNDTVKSSTTTYTLASNIENLILTGTATINGAGNTLANTIAGNTASNVLNGGGGVDRMVGGAGNDTYITDGSDTIVEASNEGTDTVQSTVTLTIGDNVENLTLIGTATVDATGNTLANTITGNSAANILNGGTGSDRLVGGAGDDTYVTDGFETIVEASNQGTDIVKSSATYTLGDNIENLTLTGTAAINGSGNNLANLINGLVNTSANVLSGLQGNDTYIVGAGDSVSETASGTAGGIDLVNSGVSFVLGSNVENLTLTGTTTINGTGNTLANTIIGNAAANILNGGTGTDRLVGGAGNDTFVIDGGDTIVEASGQGTDIVKSSATYALAANIENLALTGTATANGTGNALANIITGNTAANILNGGAGNDRLAGGAGNDTYITDGFDTIVEASSQGTDIVQSIVTFTLGSNLENLTLIGTANINGTGNSLANTINGNAAANILDGGSGGDRLAGGLGVDLLIGGLGNDAFVFNTSPHSASNIDVITDFSSTSSNNDLLQLENAIFAKLGSAGAMKSDYFKLSTQTQDANDYIVYNKATGGLFYDADGNGAKTGVQFAALLASPTLTAADFVII